MGKAPTKAKKGAEMGSDTTPTLAPSGNGEGEPDDGLSPLGRKLAGSLRRLNESLESGEPLERRFTVRQASIDLDPGEYTPEKVRATRDLLGLSQPLFGRFLGVDVKTVRAWEQGTRNPIGTARRLMDEIGRDPAYWRKRLEGMIRIETKGPTG